MNPTINNTKEKDANIRDSHQIQKQKQEYIQVKFQWKKHYWLAKFNVFSYTEFDAILTKVTFNPSQHETETRCKRLKDFLEQSVQKSFHKIESTNVALPEEILNICSIMYFLTNIHKQKKWKYLTKILENPNFEYKQEMSIQDALSTIKHTDFVEFFKLPCIISDPAIKSFVDVFVTWKDYKIRCAVNGLTYTSFEKIVKNTVNDFENTLVLCMHKSMLKKEPLNVMEQNVIFYCKTNENLLQDFFNHYTLTGDVDKPILLRMFCYLYFITRRCKDPKWKFLQFLSNKCSFVYRVPTYCAFCNQHSDLNRKRCAGCKFSKIYYCSSDCQHQHWHEHKLLCESRAKSNVSNDVD